MTTCDHANITLESTLYVCMSCGLVMNTRSYDLIFTTCNNSWRRDPNFKWTRADELYMTCYGTTLRSRNKQLLHFLEERFTLRRAK